MNSIAENLRSIRSSIPEGVTLVAVSKTKPVSDLQEAYDAGQRIFGENKVQEILDKAQQLPNDIEWHMIGHLQTNKVKQLVPVVSLIHGVDSLKLLQEINKQAEKIDRAIPVLLQMHIASEETKFGMDFDEIESLLQSHEVVEMQHISIRGLMGMASFTDDERQVRDEFSNLHNYFQLIKSHYFKFNPEFSIISMGMSGDYQIAIDEGSTMVRVGSAIFGSR